jgi:uncharacterized phage protein gp47/JayE
MPFERPTLSELQAQARADLAESVGGANALLRNSNLGVLADVLAGMAHLHYGYLDWVSRQAVPFTATGEYLEAWAGLKGVVRKPATAAAGIVTFDGTIGVTVPAGTPLVRDDGAAFTSTADATVGGGGTVAVHATADVAGASGNGEVAVGMSLNTTLADIDSSGTVSTAFVGGADIETDDDLRTRMLQAYQDPPHGGASADYIGWALAVPGVTRAWVVENGSGDGTVDVYVMLDAVEAGFNGFPQGTDGVATSETRDTAAVGDQLLVANYIYPLRPVTALVYVKAPIAHAINFTISGLSGAGSTVQDAIKDAIADLFRRSGSPGGTILLSDVEAAIVAVQGSAGFIITIPAADITNSAGHIPTLGTVTWT